MKIDICDGHGYKLNFEYSNIWHVFILGRCIFASHGCIIVSINNMLYVSLLGVSKFFYNNSVAINIKYIQYF